MTSVLDRYIIRYFLSYSFASLTLFVSLFIAIDSVSKISRFDASTTVLLSYYFYSLPAIVHLMIPASVLASTIFVLSNLSRTNEMTAVFNMGVGLFRICTPILILAALFSSITFWIGDRILPAFEKRRNYVFYAEIKKQPGLYSLVKTNKIWYRSGDILFNIKTLNPDKKMAQGITLYYFDPAWNLIQVIAAKEVSIDRGSWTLSDGHLTLFATESSFPLTQSFTTKQIYLGEEVADLSSTARSSSVLTLHDLNRFIAKNKTAGLDTVAFEVDYHSKMSFPISPIVMALMGIPFSLRKPRASGGSALMGLGICVGLAFLYWIIYNSFVTLGKHGAIMPVLAAWTPNGILLLISIVICFRLRK